MQGLLFIYSCLAFVFCLSLGGEVLLFGKLKQFLTSQRGLQDFRELVSFPHTSDPFFPCLSLSLPAGVCQSWVPDAK